MAVEMDIVERLGGLLDCGDIKSVKSIINEDGFGCVVEQRANDLIPTASYFFNQETSDNNPRVFKYAEKIVNMCAEKGNPKECLMEYLAQVESLNDLKFEILLKPIQTVMLRIPDRKAPLMQCVFNICHKYINSLTAPEYHHFDSKSKLLLDFDDNGIKIRHIYELLVGFYEPFVEEASVKSNDKRVKANRLVVIQAIFHLLGYPLVFLDLEDNIKGTSRFRVLASKILKFIHNLNGDFLSYLTLVEDNYLVTVDDEKKLVKEFSSNEFKLSDLSLSSFFYLVFAENLLPSCFCVYDKLFIVKNCLCLSVTLLRYKERMVLRKGLLLTKATIEKVEPGSLKFSHLSSNAHKEVLTLLSTISIYHDVEEDRKIAVELMRQYFFMFESKAQFYILLNIGTISRHPNIIGFFITILTKTVQNVYTNENLHKYFTGKLLNDLLQIFCSLDKDVETDLIENKEHILSALNLIIFLTKRDRDNFTGVWDYIERVNEQFCLPLKEAIKLSRAHFKLELDKLSEGVVKEDMPEFSVTVGVEELSTMSLEEKKNVINSGLTVFDLIEHVLIRTIESFAAKPTHS